MWSLSRNAGYALSNHPALVAIICFRGDKLYHWHIYWDQASLLVQLGPIDRAAGREHRVRSEAAERASAVEPSDEQLHVPARRRGAVPEPLIDITPGRRSAGRWPRPCEAVKTRFSIAQLRDPDSSLGRAQPS